MKRWKIIFVLLVAAGAGTLYYFLDIKEYKTADTKVDEIVKSDYKIKLPGEDSGENSVEDSSGAEAKGQSSNQTTETLAAAAGKDSSADSEKKLVQVSSAGNKVTKLTAAEILAKFQPAFKELESQADGKLNTLLSYAISEYQTKQANGEEISYFYFYSKYNGAAKTLEASTDDSFYYIYNALVKELGNSGYSISDAKTIKDHYVSLKKQRRSSLMNKAVAHIK